jgi:predicted CXXCH cytochrome family protein
MRKKISIAIILAIGFGLIALTSFNSYGGTVIGSKHDLMHANNVSGGHLLFLPFSFINDYGEVCVYCHTPHNGNTEAPLWNKSVTTTGYTPYTSPTMDTSPTGTISGVSAACLSCHDGTQAVDSVINAPGAGTNLTGPWPNGKTEATTHGAMYDANDGGFPLGNDCGDCHGNPAAPWPGHDQSAAYMSQDLSNDHPISMAYPTPAQDPDFKTTNEVTGAGVILYGGAGDMVECPSCHNPHDPDNVPFLRISNSGSALCKACHLK